MQVGVELDANDFAESKLRGEEQHYAPATGSEIDERRGVDVGTELTENGAHRSDGGRQVVEIVGVQEGRTFRPGTA